jgi:hypothetical protein
MHSSAPESLIVAVMRPGVAAGRHSTARPVHVAIGYSGPHQFECRMRV